MAKFTDRAGRAWAVDLDFETADAIRDDVGLDLIDAAVFDKTFMALAYGDPRKLREVLWLCCREQAEKAAVDRAAFSKGFGPAQLHAALEAIQEAVASFSPRPELAEAKRQAFRAITEMARKQMPAAMTAQIRKAASRTPDDSDGNSPASSAESPTSAA